ncbi:MAG: hypothetical protein V1720_06325, partial [bacterium]
MTNPDSQITIATVNWYSCAYLENLFDNLLKKAQHPEKLCFVVVDNTGGKDTLEKFKNIFQNITIIKNDPGQLKGSSA